MSRVEVIFNEEAKRIEAGRATARGGALRPGHTDITEPAMKAVAQLLACDLGYGIVEIEGQKFELHLLRSGGA